MRCILDASAALSLVLDDEFTTGSQRILDHLLDHGGIVPTLWSFEVTNGLWAANRRGRLTDEGVAHAIVGLDRLPIDHDPTRPPTGELIGMAQAFDLSAYDAAYLWLAQHRRSPLATRDQGLADAAREAGIDLIS